MENRVIILVGPTACGKTEIGVKLARRLCTEVISADSMQIYKEMSIATAKPTVEEMEEIPHHLIDYIYPNQNHSVACFKTDAIEKIETMHKKNTIPLIVGGTGLYINCLTLPWLSEETCVDEEKKRLFFEKYESKTNEDLFEKLKCIDPDSAETIHINNRKRLLRALEVYEFTGKTKTQQDKEALKNQLPYEFIMLGLTMDRKRLYERINLRVDKMLENGLLDETQILLSKGYSEELISLKAIGYKEMFPYLHGKESLEECIRVLKRDTRHFAKRQLTWFRKDKRIKWFDLDTAPVDAIIDAMIAYIDSYQNR